MYQILLADDEPIFLDYLEKSIPWADYGCEILGRAENGEETLRKLQEVKPDIVFLDISMAKMDGLKVCEAMHKLGVTTRTIIMTAHDEFTFAHQAIKLNVTDYLLKPFDSQELVPALKKCIADIEYSKRVSQMGRKQAEQNRKDVLREAIANGICRDAAPEFCRNKNFLVSVIHPTHRNWEENWLKEAIKSSFTQDSEIRFSLLEREYHCAVVAFLWPQGKNPLFLEQGLHRLLKNPEISSVAIGNIVNDLERLQDSNRQAHIAFENSAKLGKRLVRYEAVQKQAQENLAYNLQDINLLIRYFESGKYKEVNTIIDQIFGLTEGCIFSYQYVLSAFHTIVICIYSHFYDCRPSGRVQDYLSVGNNLIRDLESCSTCRQMSETIYDYIYEVFIDCMNIQIASRKDRLVTKIERYLQEHYQDADLTIGQIAENIHFENSYLRRVYKLQTGMTIMQRLEAIRIGEAEKLLLSSGKSHAEIAKLTGFNDQYYFSRRFKLCCGCTPTEFQLTHSSHLISHHQRQAVQKKRMGA